MDPITGITARINTSFDSLINFDPDRDTYDLEVPSDCFGVLLKLEYDPDYYIPMSWRAKDFQRMMLQKNSRVL